jgi:hypothetical protein
MAIVNEYKLSNKWNFYIHLQDVEEWDFSSYHNIHTIDNVEQAILLSDEINFDLIKKTMIFIMKNDIKPMWEDPENKQGGGFSFKVHNKNIEYVWKKLFFMLIGNTLSKEHESINGISISPKKSFCIVKVWMKDCKHINPIILANIEYMDKVGCLFKKHVS